MKIYTCSLRNIDLCRSNNITPFNITVKSGDQFYAPTWGILMEHKNDQNDEKYLMQFIPLMEKRFQENPEKVHELFKNQSLALLCYCKSGDFCHRHYIVQLLEEFANLNNLEFEYCGELV